MRARTSTLSLLTLAGLAAFASGAAAQQFYLTGDLAGGGDNSAMLDVSSTGVAVGFGNGANGPGPDGTEPVYWDRASGLRTFAAPGALDGTAYAITGDGRFIMGAADDGALIGIFRWSQTSGFEYVYTSGGAAPRAISGDGQVIVGELDLGPAQSEAFRWTDASGLVSIGELSGGDIDANARAVSFEGSVVAGSSENTRGTTAVRWTQATGMQSLDEPRPDADFSEAVDISPDGATILGNQRLGGFSAPFLWTEATGMQSIGNIFPGAPDAADWVATATGFSDDGSVIVGNAKQDFTTGLYVPFVWTPSTGYRDLNDVLSDDFGYELTGWVINSVDSVSPDGTIVAGQASSTDAPGIRSGFVVFLTPQCAADVNLDGAVTPTDFNAWINAFNNNLPMCDQNNDFECAPTDFNAWIGNFNAGC